MSHPPALPFEGRFLLILSAAVLLVPAAAMVYLGRPMLAILPLLVPPALWLLTTPRVTLYLFLLSLGIYLPYYTGYFAIHLMDVALGLLFLGTFLEFLLRDRTMIRSSGVDIPFLALIGTTVLSAVFAHDPRLSVVPVLRIVTLYIAFRLLFKFALEIPIRRLLEFYLGLVFALSLITTGQLIMTGGSLRVFGPAWLAMQYFAMTAIPVSLCFFIWSTSTISRLRYSLYTLFAFIAILAMQSRAPLVALAITIPILLVLFYRHLRHERQGTAYRNLWSVLAVIGVGAIVMVVFSNTLFAGTLDRISEFIRSYGSPKGTVALRLVLWSAAFDAFLENPLVGLGIGNFRAVDQVFPDLKFIPTWRWVQGMSAHNVILHYLAETGLFGTLSLLALTVAGVRMAIRTIREKLAMRDRPVAYALFAVMLVFAVTLTYMRAWTWEQGGYIMAFIFALNAAWRYRRKNTVSSTAAAE